MKQKFLKYAQKFLKYAIIFVVFMILKLTHTGPLTHWSWLWITSPLWIPIAAFLVLLSMCWVHKYTKGVRIK
jgi:hypothetical protein